MSHPPPQVDVAPSPPPVLPEEPLVEDSAAIEKVAKDLMAWFIFAIKNKTKTTKPYTLNLG